MWADTTDSLLTRCQFFEIIVRIAHERYLYQDTTPAEKVKSLVEEFILPNSPSSNAFKTRRQKIYTYEVNQHLETNIRQLQVLYNNLNQSKTGIRISEAKKMVNTIIPSLSAQEIMKAYSFSKMHIVDEDEDSESYFKLSFVEFLEFLCRVSDLVNSKDVKPEDQLIWMLEKLQKSYDFVKKEPNTHGRRLSFLG